ncbi:hypothetical protein LguiA_006048 [Lonicera macranthoides]
MSMVDLDQNETTPSTTLKMFAKKKELLSDTMKRTSEWIFSQEIPSDVTVHVGGASFSLHKFPLLSKSGYMRKLLSESDKANLSVIEMPDVPGGAESFELAAKFCYGINFEINTKNIAMLRCVAEYLEMTEEHTVGNLVARTEAYLNEVALKTLASAVSILHSSQSLLPLAEKVKLVNRCIDTIAYIACKNNHISSRQESGTNDVLSSSQSKPVLDWWAEDLIVLRIDVFQRVVIAIIARGLKQYALGPLLMFYTQESLRGLELFGRERKKIEVTQEHEKRVVLEIIVSLLPREKNAIPVSFLSMVLRAASCLETTVACRLDLEKRIGLQLVEAVLDDLLIPSFSLVGNTMLDVDAVQRIMMNFLESEIENYVSPSQSEMEKVVRLMESYLADIASDGNLSVSKFVNLAEIIPERAKLNDDGMYRAIDIYLKAHPAISDTEKKKICSVMDCQKLSKEACAHAAQNDRLPVQTVVQVLYYEQQRLREALEGTTFTGAESPAVTTKVEVCSTDIHPIPCELSSLERENQDLKLELLKMKMKLKEKEKDKPVAISSPSVGFPTAENPRLPRKSFISSVSKRIGRFYPFGRDGITPPTTKGSNEVRRDRRYSIS